jgi:hypothetical protein
MTNKKTTYTIFSTDRESCADAIRAGRLQTGAEGSSWHFLGVFYGTRKEAIENVEFQVIKGGFVAARLFIASGSGIGRLVYTSVREEAKAPRLWRKLKSFDVYKGDAYVGTTS